MQKVLFFLRICKHSNFILFFYWPNATESKNEVLSFRSFTGAKLQKEKAKNGRELSVLPAGGRQGRKSELQLLPIAAEQEVMSEKAA